MRGFRSGHRISETDWPTHLLFAKDMLHQQSDVPGATQTPHRAGHGHTETPAHQVSRCASYDIGAMDFLMKLIVFNSSYHIRVNVIFCTVLELGLVLAACYFSGTPSPDFSVRYTEQYPH